MSTLNCFFSHAPFSNSPPVGFWFSGLQLEDITGLRCCPLHLLRRGQNHSRHKLQREDTDATVIAGKPASVPSALLSRLPLSHTFLYKQQSKRSWVNSFHALTSICPYFSWDQRPSLCCDCAVLIESQKQYLFSCQTRSGHGTVKQARTDLGANGCNERHTQSKTLRVSKHSLPNLQKLHCTHTYQPGTLTPLIHSHM